MKSSATLRSGACPPVYSHGDIVDIEHAYRMKFALDQAGKDYEFHVLDGAGHDMGTPVQAAKLYGDLVTFLNQHLLPANLASN